MEKFPIQCNVVSGTIQMTRKERLAANSRRWLERHPGAGAAKSKRWRERHPEKYRDSVARTCAKHREARNERTRKWQKENPEKVKSACRNWRKNNPEKAKIGWLKWNSENPDRVKSFWRRNGAKRRAQKRKALVGDLPAIRKIYDRCSELRKWFNVTVDHIIPLSRNGKHSPENLQIIYVSENATKHAKLNYKPKVIFT